MRPKATSVKKPERKVPDQSPDTKSILKKNQSQDRSTQQKFSDNTGLIYNEIQPGESYQIKPKIEPNNEDLVIPGSSVVDSNQPVQQLEQLGGGTHAMIMDQRFEQYLAGQKKLAFELGEQNRAIKNLQFSLQERIALYDTKDNKIWKLTETKSDIAINFAIQMIRLGRSEQAIEYLNIARKALEPLPGSEWSERHEWHVLRRDLYKNLALFHQNQEEWQKSFDNLRIAITHERRIGDNTANTSLTCGVLLSKMNRFAESIEFAQESCNEIEKAIGITHAKPLHEYKYNAKALLNLQYFKEARHFLTKASTAVTKCLNIPKKELAVAISNDMARVTQVSRGNLKTLTDQQVQGSLVTIKTDLATRAMSGIGGDRIEQRQVMRNLEQQLEQEKTEGPTTNVPENSSQQPYQQQDDVERDFSERDSKNGGQTEVKTNKVQTKGSKDKSEPKKLLFHKDPVPEQKEATEKTKRKSVRSNSESVSQVVQKGQEVEQNNSTDGKKQSSSKKQKLRPEDDFLNVEKYPVLKEKLKKNNSRAAQLEEKKEVEAKKIDGTANKNKPDSQKKEGSYVPPTPKRKRLKSQNVKTFNKNLASQGAEEDVVGVKYSQTRSVQSYLRARKQQIREVNKGLGYSESDQSLESENNKPQETANVQQVKIENESTKLPPINDKKPSNLPKMSRADAIKQGLGSQDAALIAQSQDRRQFKPAKQQVTNIDPETQISAGMELLMNTFQKGAQLKQTQKAQTPEESSESEMDLADEITTRLQKQINQKEASQKNLFDQQNKKPNEEIKDLYFDIFTQKPSETEDLFLGQQLQAIADEKNKKIVELPQIQPNTNKVPNTPNNQSKLKSGLAKPVSRNQIGQQNSARVDKKSTIQVSQKESQVSKSKIDSGLKSKRRHGEPIEELNTLKRQGTPPLKSEKDQKKLMKLKNKISTKQPSETKNDKDDEIQGNVRTSLIYALKKEKNMNVGVISSRAESSQSKPEKQSKFVKEVSNDDPDQNDRKVLNQFRLRELSAPKPKNIQTKELTEEQKEKKAERERQIEERRGNSKFDFYNFLNRDSSQQDQPNRPDFQAGGYKPLQGMQRKKNDRKQRLEEQQKSPDRQQQSVQDEQKINDDTLARAEDISQISHQVSTNNLAAIVQKASHAEQEQKISSNDGSQAFVNIVTQNRKNLSSQDDISARRNSISQQRQKQQFPSQGDASPGPNDRIKNGLGQLLQNNQKNQILKSPVKNVELRNGGKQTEPNTPLINKRDNLFVGSSVMNRQKSGLPPKDENRLQNNRSEYQQLDSKIDTVSKQKVQEEDDEMMETQADPFVRQKKTQKNPVSTSRMQDRTPDQMTTQRNIASQGSQQKSTKQTSSDQNQRRKGKAPSQTLIVNEVKQKNKRTTNPIRNPYESYVQVQQKYEEDSEIINDRNHKEQVSSLKQLRNLEFSKAIKIQSLVRQFLTRKWYMNLLIRRRLSVPYSGLDFAQNPFLRQFNRVNQRMQVGSTPIAEVINVQKSERKKNLIQVNNKAKNINALTNQKQKEEQALVSDTNTAILINNKVDAPTRKIGQGATPSQLLAQLKNEFIEKGLDAYEQFKKLGVGVDFNENGQAFAEGGVQKVRKLIEEQRIARLEFIGTKNILDREERAELDPQKLESQETKEYMKKIDDRRSFVKDKTGAADNLSNNMRAVMTTVELHKSNEFPIDEYQKLSREPIVFYKNMGYADNQVKWTIFAGNAFIQEQKMFIPIKIIGKPLKARSTIISYTMNLELLHIPRESTKKFEFETIWPYILYLFNNWVKHQVTLMGIKRILPGMQDRLPQSNYTIFECHNDLKADFDALEDEAYKDILNFSSELEIDPRFEAEDLHKQVNIEKSRPEGIRKTLKESAQAKRKRLFNEYRNSVARAIDMQEKQIDMQKGRRFVQFAEQLIDNLTVEEQLKILGENKDQEQKFSMNQRDVDQFKQFLADSYVRLPKPSSNQIKLMSAMSQSVYWLMEKKGGLPSMQIALMNEERRRIKQLPSLSQLDYNCIDRAAIKLRLILDCLQVDRRVSGNALVPRNLKQQQRIQQYMQTVRGYIEMCLKKSTLSMNLLKLLGKIISYEPAFDQNTVGVKIKDKIGQNNLFGSQNQQSQGSQQQQKKIQSQKQYEDEMDQEILGNQESFKSSQIGGIFRIQTIPIPRVNYSETQAEILIERSPRQNEFGEPFFENEDPNIFQLYEQNDQKAFKQKMFLEKFEIETVIQDEQVLEQGIIRFNGLVYVSTLVYKKISCNFDNMTILHQIREQKYQKENKKFPIAKKKIEIDLQDRSVREQRLKPKPCTFASSHPQVVENDNEFLVANNLEGNKLLDLQLFMSNLIWTIYSSYVELKVCPRLSSTLWADSVLVTWEQIGQFFDFFGIKNWEPSSFLKRQKFNQDEALIFYTYFQECLAINEDDAVTLTFSLARLNPIRHRYDMIFLSLHRYEWTQRMLNLNFFIPDVLINNNFDPCQFDELAYPFLQDPMLVNNRLMSLNPKEKEINKDFKTNQQNNFEWLFGKMTNKEFSSKLEINKDFEEGEKPNILIEESTKAYLNDPACLFNLTLSKFPKAETLFLGNLSLRQVKSDFEVSFTVTNAAKQNKAIQTTSTLTKYNVRIEYYVRGVLPCLQVIAFSQLASQGGSQSLVLKKILHNQKLIKDLIRICKQTSQQMVYNQLQSIFAVENCLNGRRLQINHSITRQKRINSATQDLHSMLILNESILAQRLGPHNTNKYKGIINLRNVSSGMSSVMVSLNQYDVQQELLIQHGDLMIDLIHGNKHITQQMISRTRELILQHTLEEDAQKNIKEFRPLTVWKITILDLRKSTKHDAILTEDDLTYFFQSEIFKFFRDNPQIQMPSILTVLTEFLLNLYNVRTPVGVTLAWNLPTYKPQIDKDGLHVEIPPEQYYKMPMLNVYQSFARIRELQNTFNDQNKLPVSLDQDKKIRLNGKIPKLCLRTRQAIEKVLPVYELEDMRSLKYSSREYRIITQVMRQFKSISEFHFALVTVCQHEAIEGWIWTLYFPITQRTFTVTFFQSDLIGLDSKLFKNVEEYEGEAALWTKIVNETQLIPNIMGDIVLKVDSFSESIKELLYQTYIYNEKSKDLYYMEVTIKSFSNYVTEMNKAFPCIDLKDDKQSKDYTISLRAFSMAKEQWIKDYQPLAEVIAMLKQDGIQWNSSAEQDGKIVSKGLGVDPDDLMEVSKKTTNFYYSMVRNAAVLMANKIKFSDQPKQNAEVRKRKLTYDLQQILKAKKNPDLPSSIQLRSDFVNLVVLNRVIYQATVALNPIQVCSISYNESKDRFVYRLYRPFSGCESIERRFDGAEIQMTCSPHYLTMLANGMEKELGQRIAKFYHSNILVASVLQINNLQGLVEAYPNLNANTSISKQY